MVQEKMRACMHAYKHHMIRVCTIKHTSNDKTNGIKRKLLNLRKGYMELPCIIFLQFFFMFEIVSK